MNRRKFFLVSLALALLALFLQLAGLAFGSRGASLRAQAVQRVADRGGGSLTAEERNELKAQTDAYRHRGAIAQCCGGAVALTSIGFAVMSARKKEPAWRSLTFAVLFIYALSLFMLVWHDDPPGTFTGLRDELQFTCGPPLTRRQ